MKEALWAKKRFLRHMLKSCITNIKADRKGSVSLYDFVDRAIPWRVARQHCPTLFDHGNQKINNLEDTIYKFFKGDRTVISCLQRLLLAKATKSLFVYEGY